LRKENPTKTEEKIVEKDTPLAKSDPNFPSLGETISQKPSMVKKEDITTKNINQSKIQSGKIDDKKLLEEHKVPQSQGKKEIQASGSNPRYVEDFPSL